MTPALKALYRLWNTPGEVMAPAWWEILELAAYHEAYRQIPQIRPALNALIRQRLGHIGPPPELTEIATEVFSSEKRQLTLCVALGLWALRCRNKLLLKPYRDALASYLDPLTLNQLILLLPQQACAAEYSPSTLPAQALASGTAWLVHTSDPALHLCRLLQSPGSSDIPFVAPEVVLQKLIKWL